VVVRLGMFRRRNLQKPNSPNYLAFKLPAIALGAQFQLRQKKKKTKSKKYFLTYFTEEESETKMKKYS
jgi:hypothetical protein